jgi:hypothetical protein
MPVTQLIGPGHVGKLGRHPFVPDSRDFNAMHLISAPTPFAPSACSWEGPTRDDAMLLNDQLGCCTCSAAVHIIRQLTDVAYGAQDSIGDEDVLAAYQAACGYIPGRSDTDHGGSMRDVLKLWRSVGIGEHRIDGFARLFEPSDAFVHMSQIKTLHFLFGALYVGADMPKAWRYMSVWDLPDGQKMTGDFAPRSWGGHAMNTIEYRRGGSAPLEDLWTLETWGRTQLVTGRAMRAYFPEIYVVKASQDWLSDGVQAPNSFLGDELSEMLKTI